jgi:hypothetical protein
MSAPFDAAFTGEVPLFVTRRTAPPAGLPARVTEMIEDYSLGSPAGQLAALLDLADWIAERMAAVDPKLGGVCLSQIAVYQATPGNHPARPNLRRSMEQSRAILTDIAARAARNVLRSPPAQRPAPDPEGRP